MKQSNPHQLITLVILALAATLAPVSMDMLTPSLAGMSQDLQTSPRMIELSLYSFLIGYGISPSLWGILSDRMGRRPVMFAGMCLYCLSSLACALTDDASLLILVRLIQGLGAGAGATLARAVVRDLYGAAGTTRGMARMMSLMAVIPVFMPVLGGVLSQLLGWQACFVFMSLIGMISVTAYFFLVPETRPSRIADSAPDKISILQILRNPIFAQHTVCNMFSISTLVIFGANFAFLTANEFDFDSSDNGLVLALFNGSIALGMQLVWLLMPRYQTHRSILIGAATCAVGWLGVALAAQSTQVNPAMLAPGLILAGAGSGVIMSLSAGAALTPFTHNTGTASSVYLLVQSAGSSAISLAAGWYLPKELLPMASAMAACAVLAILSKVILSRNVR
jgi:DHA1 family bicyclomycin/chloramphenicol resistance-like MFS transporter